MRKPSARTLKRAARIANGLDPAPGRWPRRAPIQSTLFDASAHGQAVSLDDLTTWMQAHTPHIDPTSRRGQQYARAYDVAGKIRRAKATGHWPPPPR